MSEDVQPLEQCLTRLLEKTTEYLEKLNKATSISTDNLVHHTTICDNILSFSIFDDDKEILSEFTQAIQTILKESIPNLPNRFKTYLLDILIIYQYDDTKTIFAAEFSLETVNAWQQDIKGLLASIAGYQAAFNGDLIPLQTFVENYPSFKNKPGLWDTTLIYSAARNGHLKLVEYLVNEARCSVNAQNRRDLGFALNEKKGDFDAQVAYGSTALHSAAYYGHLEVVKFLIGKGANYFLKNQGGETAITNGQINPKIKEYFESYLVSDYLIDGKSPLPDCTIANDEKRPKFDAMWEYKPFLDEKWYKFTKASADELHKVLLPTEDFQREMDISMNNNNYHVSIIDFVRSGRDRRDPTKNMAWVRCRGSSVMNFDCLARWQVMVIKHSKYTHDPNKIPSLEISKLPEMRTSDFKLELNVWYQCDQHTNDYIEASINERRRVIPIHFETIGYGISLDLHSFEFHDRDKKIVGYIRWIPVLINDSAGDEEKYIELDNYNIPAGVNPKPLTTKRVRQVREAEAKKFGSDDHAKGGIDLDADEDETNSLMFASFMSADNAFVDDDASPSVYFNSSEDPEKYWTIDDISKEPEASITRESSIVSDASELSEDKYFYDRVGEFKTQARVERMNTASRDKQINDMSEKWMKELAELREQLENEQKLRLMAKDKDIEDQTKRIKKLEKIIREKEEADKHRQTIFDQILTFDYSPFDKYLGENLLLKHHNYIMRQMKTGRDVDRTLRGIPGMSISTNRDGFVASITGMREHHDQFKKILNRLQSLSNVVKSSKEFYSETLNRSTKSVLSIMWDKISSSIDWKIYIKIYRTVVDEQQTKFKSDFDVAVDSEVDKLAEKCITDYGYQPWKDLKTFTKSYINKNPFRNQLENSKYVAVKRFIEKEIYHQEQKGIKKPTEKSAKMLKSFIEKVEQDIHQNGVYKDFTKMVFKNIHQALRRIRLYHQTFLLQLPLFESANDLLSKIQQNTVLSISTSTGSGKSTLLPALLAAEGYDKILVTQPRRLPCTAISKRVNETMSHSKDSFKLAGWAISGEQQNPDAPILFLTDGLLKERLLHDENFFKQSSKIKKGLVLFIDEVHERSINIDLCLALIAKLLTERVELRTKLKVIISSATLDPSVPNLFRKIPQLRFEEFKAPFLGILHKVEKIHQPNRSVLDLVQELCGKRERNEQILCFLSNTAEVKQCCHLLQEISRQTLKAAPLYQSQQGHFQQKLIESESIFFATTVAETSLTFPALKYVIDTGMINTPIYNPEDNHTSLVEVQAAESTIKQRLGRLGRTAPGVYFSVYDFKPENQKYPKPQIYLSDVLSIEFSLRRSPLKCGLEEISKYLPTEPQKKHIERAVQELKRLGIIDQNNRLTSDGHKLAELPDFGSLHMAKCVLAALDRYRCGHDLIILSSILSVLNISTIMRSIPQDYRTPDGDFMTMINMMRDILLIKESVPSKKMNWNQVFEAKRLKDIGHIIKQALRRYETLERAFSSRRDEYKRKATEGSGNWEAIAKSLLAGFGENVFVSMKELLGKSHLFTRYRTGKNEVAVLDLQSTLIRPISQDPVMIVLARDVRYSSAMRVNAVLSFVGNISSNWMDFDLIRQITLNDKELEKLNADNILSIVKNTYPSIDIILNKSEIIIKGANGHVFCAELDILRKLITDTKYTFANEFSPKDTAKFDGMKRNLEILAKMAYIFDPMKWRWQSEAQVIITVSPTVANNTLDVNIRGRDSKSSAVVNELKSFSGWLKYAAVLRHPHAGVSPRILKPQVRAKYLDMETRIAAITDSKRTEIEIWKSLKGPAATRETRMEVVAWIAVTKFFCRVEGGFVRDWVVGHRQERPKTDPKTWLKIQPQPNGKALVELDKGFIPNDLDVHLPLNKYFDVDKFQDMLHRYNIECKYFRDHWRYIFVLDENRSSGPFTMDLIEPHVALTHDQIDFDVNNLSLEKDYTKELGMRVDTTEKPYSIDIETIVDHITKKQFCILRNEDDPLKIRIDKMLSRGWQRTGEPIHVIPNPPLKYDMILVPMSSSTNLYRQLTQRLTSAIGYGLNIISIDEIRNPTLESIYLGNKAMIAKQCVGANANEKHLFHGTKGEGVDGIPKDGYDDRYWALSGKWGHGAYFAENPGVSHGYNDPGNPSVNRIMFYNKVILGKESVQTTTNPKLMSAPKDYHSVHGKPDPSKDVDEFIVYRYGQALPYLKITYRA